jgi:phospholipase C
MARMRKDFLLLGVYFAMAGIAGLDAIADEPAPACLRKMGDVPNPAQHIGIPSDQIPIEHILVIMQENHSFDNYFGKLNKPEFYGSEIDGINDEMSNLDANAKPVHAYHDAELCPKDPDHTWNGEHRSWNGGANDGFVRANGSFVMSYHDETDLPFYYTLANSFATADRYFCSALTQTFPNRFFLLTATAFGHIKNDLPWAWKDFRQPTIFENLTAAGVSWNYYTDSPLGYPHLFRPFYRRNFDHMKSLRGFRRDLKRDRLPQVVFLDSSFEGEDEHPDGNIQIGQAWVAERVHELMDSTAWLTSVLFLTYDENGGFYDHVPPPRACAPDAIPPMLGKNSLPGSYDRLGFRVPFVAISPYAKHHFVSHTVYDHTSILRFIEAKFNLPALTARDANADSMMDLFDFEHPDYRIPELASGTPDPARNCGLEDDEDDTQDITRKLFEASTFSRGDYPARIE